MRRNLIGIAIGQAWLHVRTRHCEVPRFAVIGYGKLGGKELGYASDLDLVYLYDDPDPEAGENYARLGQRRPLARAGGQVLIWYDDFAWMEHVAGPGGQLHSFEAVFSPRGDDGKPRLIADQVPPESVDAKTPRPSVAA